MELEVYTSFEDRVIQTLIQFIRVSIDTFTTYHTDWNDISKSDIAVIDLEDNVASAREMPQTIITVGAEGFSLRPGGLTDKTENYRLFQNEGQIGPYLINEDYSIVVRSRRAKEASRLVAWLATLFLVKKEKFTTDMGIADVTPVGSSKVDIVGAGDTKYAGRQLIVRVLDHITLERIALNKILINKSRVSFTGPVVRT